MSANLENSVMATGLEKFSFFEYERQAMPKNVQTTVQLCSHVSKVFLKILQTRLQQYMNWEVPDVPAGLQRGRGTRDQIANICWIMGKTREFHKNICFTDYAKTFDYVDHNKLWEFLKEMGVPDNLTSLLRNLYVGQEATVRTRYGITDWFKIIKQGYIYCHPAYLTSMHSTSCEILGRMNR